MDVNILELTSQQVAKEISGILAGFHLDDSHLHKLKNAFEQELEIGLVDGLSRSCLQMENTYVPELLNGTESGIYLALDLGGTNFRVMLLKMDQGVFVHEHVAYYSVPEKTRLGPGEDLFDFLALCIKDFLVKNTEMDKIEGKIPLGFTFSFPMTQKGLNVGILVSWTKSFNCPGVVGKDAVKMLNDAIKRIGHLPVEVVAVLNDTTGTLVKGTYDDKDTCIGLILGTGCNGAYLEKADKVAHWEGDRCGAQEVIIDPEWGAFGDNGCIDFVKTEFDRILDKNSLLPGSFTYEKYFAGKYIGELTRLILTKLHEMNLFLGTEEKIVFPKGSVSAIDVSHIVDGEPEVIINFLMRLCGTSSPTFGTDDITIVKHVCKLLTERCCFLVSIPLSTFINRRPDKEMVSIAVTGSLYKHHPTLKSTLEKYIARFSPGRQFKLFLSDDGSGKGAGLVAAIACRLANQKA